MANSRKVFFNGRTYDGIDADAEVEEIQESLSRIVPGIDNAEGVLLDNGDIRFETRSGTKG